MMKTTNIKTIAELATIIHERRLLKNMTMQQVADLLDWPRQQVAKIEAGQKSGVKYYLEVIEALGGQLKVDWK